MRTEELERHLNQDPDSLELKYYNAISTELDRQRAMVRDAQSESAV